MSSALNPVFHPTIDLPAESSGHEPEVAATSGKNPQPSERILVVKKAPLAQPLEIPATTPGRGLLNDQGAMSNEQVGNRVTGWEGVRFWAQTAAKFERCSLVCQVMAGIELVALHQVKRVKAGNQGKGASLNEQGASGKKFNSNTMLELDVPKDESFGGKRWVDLVKEFAGVSEMTAWRWMEMARAVKPRLKKLGGDERLRTLLALPVAEWTADDQAVIEAAVHKVADGRTQLDFMMELGIAKKPMHGKGGARENTHPKRGVDEIMRLNEQMAREDWVAIGNLFESTGDKWTLLPDAEIEAMVGYLERQLKARKAWLAVPAVRRNSETAIEVRSILA
jgi:hypothetical protein